MFVLSVLLCTIFLKIFFLRIWFANIEFREIPRIFIVNMCSKNDEFDAKYDWKSEIAMFAKFAKNKSSNISTNTCENSEIGAVQKNADLADLEKCWERAIQDLSQGTYILKLLFMESSNLLWILNLQRRRRSASSRRGRLPRGRALPRRYRARRTGRTRCRRRRGLARRQWAGPPRACATVRTRGR